MAKWRPVWVWLVAGLLVRLWLVVRGFPLHSESFLSQRVSSNVSSEAPVGGQVKRGVSRNSKRLFSRNSKELFCRNRKRLFSRN